MVIVPTSYNDFFAHTSHSLHFPLFFPLHLRHGLSLYSFNSSVESSANISWSSISALCRDSCSHSHSVILLLLDILLSFIPTTLSQDEQVRKNRSRSLCRPKTTFHFRFQESFSCSPFGDPAEGEKRTSTEPPLNYVFFSTPVSPSLSGHGGIFCFLVAHPITSTCV